jgi:DNA-binding GntR family transcriptional regulator
MTDISASTSGGPTYSGEQIADHLAARIKIGDIKHKIPAERALAEEYEVAYEPIRHAMATLRARGLIFTRQGRGTFVTADQA